MLRWIVGSSLKFRFLVLALAVALMVFGVSRLRHMSVDVFPEFAPPRVEIQTSTLGLSPEEVEGLVTIPLEQALQGVDGLDVMRSKSVEQLSSVLLIFKPGTDLIRARQLVQERVATVAPTLPSWAAPPTLLPPLSSTARTMKIGLSSSELTLIELSEVTRWKIRPRLMDVRGVANVAVWGQRKRSMQVQVDPEKLREQNVSLEAVMKATGDALDVGVLQFSNGAMIGAGGWLDTEGQRLGIRHILPVTHADDLAYMTVVTKDGQRVRLGDVAKLVESHPPLIGDAVINDGDGLLLIVEKFPWANTLEVTQGVEAALEALRPGLVGVEIDSTIFRPATFIELSLENLTRAMLIGAVLVILVLIAFLFEWRTALISLVAIPLSLLSAALVLYFRGTTINTMVLAGLIIALGEVVDDAIIDVENIVRRLRQHRAEGSTKSTARIIFEASLEVRNAIVYATLISALAVMPVFFMQGLSGAFFRPLALSYALAMLASMVVALTVTPALSLLLLHKAPLERRQSPLIPRLQRVYQAILQRTIRTPRPAYLTIGIIALAGLLILPRLGQQLLPSFKERDFLMHWVGKPGTSLPEMDRISTVACQELRTIPGVRNCGSHIGQALVMDEVYGVYFGENWISVDPSVDYDVTLTKVQELVDGYPGLKRDVQTYLKERIREVLTGGSEAIIVRIFGQDLDVLREKANEVRDAMAGVDGLQDLHVELQENIAHVEVEVDLTAAQNYGLKPGDVRRAAATWVNSIEVGDVFRNGQVFDVNVIATSENRNDLTALRNIPIDTPDGGTVRLEDVAAVRIAPTPNAIRREGSSRRIDVQANVDANGRDLGSIVADVEAALAKIEFPLEYHPELLGEYAELQAAQRSLIGYTLAAVFGIFLLLQASFKSWRLAVLAFLALPAALVGGVIAAYITGGIISLGSLVGFLTVLGIAARNGIMLINHYQHLEDFEGEHFGPEMILRGAKERLAPILMTALVTGLALVPLVIAGNIPGHEIEHPMAIVILGGLITSTLLNLFVIPSLYLRFGQIKQTAPQRNLRVLPSAGD
jgi:CzcA family heavy metal efflux pump